MMQTTCMISFFKHGKWGPLILYDIKRVHIGVRSLHAPTQSGTKNAFA